MCIRHGNYFLLPPQRWVGAPATTTFQSEQELCELFAASMNPVMKGTTFPQFVKNKIRLSFASNLGCDELDTSPQNAFWWGQRSHQSSGLMCGPCNWSNCPSRVRTVEINQDVENTFLVAPLPFGVNYWVWCSYNHIPIWPHSRSPQCGPPVRLFPDLTYHGAHEMRIPPVMNVNVRMLDVIGIGKQTHKALDGKW